MIISASRRTDIPAYYPDWFYNRIREGYVCVRNPMNFHQVSRISLSPDVVDGIVFWTKNPLPLMPRLEELRAYPFYFQFTLTPYGKDGIGRAFCLFRFDYFFGLLGNHYQSSKTTSLSSINDICTYFS